MNHLILSLLLALPPQAPQSPPALPPQAPQASSPQWHSSYSDAMAERERLGKPLLIDFRTSSCPHCVTLDAVLDGDPAVRDALSNFVLLKIDGERDDKGRSLVAKFPIKGYPTLVVVSPEASRKAWVILEGPAPASFVLQQLLSRQNLTTAPSRSSRPSSASVKTSTVIGHSHWCPRCREETVFHASGSFGSAADHTCPKCGKVLPRPWTVYRNGVPVSVAVRSGSS